MVSHARHPRNVRRKTLIASALALLGALSIACADDTTGPDARPPETPNLIVYGSSASATGDLSTINVGDSTYIEMVTVPVGSVSVDWVSSIPSVATVTKVSTWRALIRGISPGSAIITGITKDAGGNQTGVADAPIHVISGPLKANITGPTSIPTTGSYTWYASATGGTGYYNGWTWYKSTNGGSTWQYLTQYATTLTLSVSATSSPFLLKLTVMDGSEASASAIHSVATALQPTVSVSGPGTVTIKKSYTFTATGTNFGNSPSFAWQYRYCTSTSTGCDPWGNAGGGNPYTPVLTPDCSGSGLANFQSRVTVTRSEDNASATSALKRTYLCASP